MLLKSFVLKMALCGWNIFQK